MGGEKRMRESWAGSVGVCGWGGGMGANTMPLPSCHVYPCSRRLLEDSSKAPSALARRFVSELLRSFTSTRRSKGTITPTEDV